MKNYGLLILNYVIIALILALRINAAGWILLMFGLILIPVVIIHIISTTIGLMKFSQQPKINKILVIVSIILFFIFFLFQYEMDDYKSYMIAEAYVRIIFKTEYTDLGNLAKYISIISGFLLVITDLTILINIRRIESDKKSRG